MTQTHVLRYSRAQVFTESDKKLLVYSVCCIVSRRVTIVLEKPLKQQQDCSYFCTVCDQMVTYSRTHIHSRIILITQIHRYSSTSSTSSSTNFSLRCSRSELEHMLARVLNCKTIVHQVIAHSAYSHTQVLTHSDNHL
jgi:hypothetical protein